MFDFRVDYLHMVDISLYLGSATKAGCLAIRGLRENILFNDRRRNTAVTAISTY